MLLYCTTCTMWMSHLVVVGMIFIDCRHTTGLCFFYGGTYHYGGCCVGMNDTMLLKNNRGRVLHTVRQTDTF
jgi:hypothetical protein